MVLCVINNQNIDAPGINFLISKFNDCKLLFETISAQTFKQTIKGQIVDKQSKHPMPGANVVVVNTIPAIGSSTDPNGYFKI